MGRVIPNVYAVPTEGTSPRWCKAFAAGCHGRVRNGGPLLPGPIAMFGSPSLWPLLTKSQEQGRTWYYGDHAYFGRGQFYRCTRNAKQHDGRGEADPARFLSFGIRIKDWRTKGRDILLCPNSETFLGLHGYQPGEWIAATTAELRKHTDRPIVLRWKKDVPENPLSRALKNAWAVVTFTSNAAVEGILAGVPAICTAPCAGLTMGTDDLSRIENLPMPDGRLQWASVLAANQWTLAEMAKGDLWRAIGEG